MIITHLLMQAVSHGSHLLMQAVSHGSHLLMQAVSHGSHLLLQIDSKKIGEKNKKLIPQMVDFK